MKVKFRSLNGVLVELFDRKSPRRIPFIATRAAAAALILVAVGCQGRELRTREVGVTIDFDHVAEFAMRSAAIYEINSTLRERIGDGVQAVIELPNSQVRYSLDVTPASVQTVAIRGTSNLENIRLDANFLPAAATEIGVPLHSGFGNAAQEIYADLQPRLDRSAPVRLTGHSLGGAIAVVLGMRLAREGYKVTDVVTFGQPKVTSLEGAARYRTLPVTRIRMKGDPVADVPPIVRLDDAAWSYSHLGREVVLLERNNYLVYQPEDSIFEGMVNFYRNLGSHIVAEHSMEVYEQAVQARTKAALEKQKTMNGALPR